MDRLRRLEAFVRVADLASFTAAGRALGITQSQVSRAVSALERDVGGQLFVRSTRHVALTAEGQRYLQVVRTALRTLEAATDAVQESAAATTGTLRVTAPVELGELLAPVLARLLASHPGLRVDVMLADRIVDLRAEGFDVGIRFGALASSSLRVRRLGESESVLCAAPDYLKRHGVPRSARELGAHAFVVFDAKPTPDALVLYDRRGRAVRVRVDARLRVNALRLVLLATLSGAGVALLPRALVRDALASGALAIVLPSLRPRAVPVHAVFPARAPVPARLGAFLEELTRALKRPR